MVRRKTVEEGDSEGKEPTASWYEITRKVLLAGIGAAALAQEEIVQFLNRLVEKGEIVERDARRLIQELLEERERLERERKAEQIKRSATAAATKADIEALNARIAELQKRIEELQKSRE